MRRRTVLKRGLCLAVVIAMVAGCAVRPQRTFLRENQLYDMDRDTATLKAHMKDGTVYIFTTWWVDAGDREIRGTGELLDANRERVQDGDFTVRVEDVALFETNVMQKSPAIGLMAVVTVASLVVTAACIADPKACFGSCPTFYAWDGERQRLQAEGFSASIAPSLEATDVDALFRARPRARAFEITMTNEALETHVVRHADVLAVPTPAGGRVLATQDGVFVGARHLTPPSFATGPEGDVAALLSSYDGDERFSLADSLDLATREDVELEFPERDRPLGIVIACRQSLLSTYLFYQTLAYMGTQATAWLAALESDPSGPRFAAAAGIGQRLGGIDVLVQKDGDWVLAGTVKETGPLAVDTKVVPLPDIDGPVRVKLRMAKGNMRVDYVALAEIGGPLQPIRVSPSSVLHDGTADDGALAALLDRDEALTTFPGDRYVLVYDLPEDVGAHEYFLESRGYYLEWMREPWLADENAERARMLLLDPTRALRELAPAFKAVEPNMETFFWSSRYAK